MSCWGRSCSQGWPTRRSCSSSTRCSSGSPCSRCCTRSRTAGWSPAPRWWPISHSTPRPLSTSRSSSVSHTPGHRGLVCCCCAVVPLHPPLLVDMHMGGRGKRSVRKTKNCGFPFPSTYALPFTDPVRVMFKHRVHAAPTAHPRPREDPPHRRIASRAQDRKAVRPAHWGAPRRFAPAPAADAPLAIISFPPPTSHPQRLPFFARVSVCVGHACSFHAAGGTHCHASSSVLPMVSPYAITPIHCFDSGFDPKSA